MDIRNMTTFRRYALAGRVSYGVEEIVKRLEKRKFLPLDAADWGNANPKDSRGGPRSESSPRPEGEVESERYGWVTLEHILDTRFDVEKVFRDPFILFALRIDKRRVPAALVRAHLKIEERAHENASGKKTGPAKRRELREQVRRKLMERVLPAASAFQVVWHPGEGTVWFGNTGEKACEAFAAHFDDTFGVPLLAQTPRHLGLALLQGDADAIDRAAPAVFSKEAPSYRLVAAS